MRQVKRTRRAATGAAGAGLPPQPFQLATDRRGAEEQARLEGMRRQQGEAARQQASEFRALPLDRSVLGAHVWRPAPQAAAGSSHGASAPGGVPALTVPQDVMLHSDARAAARRRFDAGVAERAAELEAERAALCEAQRLQEEEEERQHRRALGHQPLPLPGRL